MTLSNCGRVNLLVGKNNSGKTSVLEALALLTRPDDLEWWIETVWSREVKSARTPEREVIKRLFPQVGIASPEELFKGSLQLKARTDMEKSRCVLATIHEEKIATRDLDYFRAVLPDGSHRELPTDVGEMHTSLAARMQVVSKMVWMPGFPGGDLGPERAIWHQFSESGALPYPPTNSYDHIPSAYVTTVAHRTENLTDRLSDALIQDRRASLLGLLQSLQPTVKGFEIVTRPRQGPQVWLQDEQAGWMPISVAGDGVRRAFHFAVAAVSAKGGVLLVDEIESALHKNALRKVFGYLVRECAELDVQIFATTHSLEALDAILAEATDEASLVVYNLSPAGAERTSLSELKVIREEHGFDIR